MSVYLAYGCRTDLSKKEQIRIDERRKKSKKEFSRGFVKGVSFSLAAYSIYS